LLGWSIFATAYVLAGWSLHPAPEATGPVLFRHDPSGSVADAYARASLKLTVDRAP
jgi:hypothetical protein